MAEQLAGVLGYVIAGVAGLISLHFWRKSQALHAAREKLAEDMAVLAAKERQQEGTLTELKGSLQDKAKKQQKMEKDLESWRQKWELLRKEEEEKRTLLAGQLTKVENHLEHYAAQTKALTEQLQEVDQEKRQLRLTWEHRLREQEEKFQQERKELEKTLATLRREQRKWENQGSKAQMELKLVSEKLESVDPQALKKAKSRLHQYHHLYQIMRGHKEMAEERNRNWELALKILATWILQEKNERQPSAENLGTLVAEALEAIKHGPLIDDAEEIALQTRQGLSRDDAGDYLPEVPWQSSPSSPIL